jgi:hypothetical protein
MGENLQKFEKILHKALINSKNLEKLQRFGEEINVVLNVFKQEIDNLRKKVRNKVFWFLKVFIKQMQTEISDLFYIRDEKTQDILS